MDKKDLDIAKNDIGQLVIDEWGIVDYTAFSSVMVKAMQDEQRFEIDDMFNRFKRTFGDENND